MVKVSVSMGVCMWGVSLTHWTSGSGGIGWWKTTDSPYHSCSTQTIFFSHFISLLHFPMIKPQHTNNLFLSLHLSPSFPYFFLKPQFSQTAVLTNILHRPLSLFFLLWLICNSTHCLQNMNTLLAIWQLQLHIEKLWSPGSSSLDHCVLCTYLLPFKWLSFSKLHNLLFKGITPPPSYHL